MKKLKEKISQALRNDGKLEITLDEVLQSQENLLKNYSNPVFSNKDKNKILKQFTNLKNIGNSLYRYNALKENDYQQDAEEEKSNIENIVLKGGISYNKYVWHSENGEHTCDVCKSLDGKVFDFYDEVPERPHPNCKCTVEVVEDSDIGEIENDGSVTESKNPNPQPAPKSPQPNSQPQAKIPQKSPKVMPVNGPITSPYGWRIHPTYGTKKFHDGVDIGVPINTPVKATVGGKVVMSQWYNGYGKYVEIDHGNNIHSFYGHLNSYEVKVGDYVNSGQTIAKSGNTAGIGKNGKVMTTGPHLHFGVHKNGQSINPLDFIRNF